MKKWLLLGLFWLILLAGLNACRENSVGLTRYGSPPRPEVAEAYLLTGYRVENLQGELLGQVSAVFVDITRGQVICVAITFDDPGVRGKAAMIVSPEKIALVPWEVLVPVASERALLLDIDNSWSLTDLPHFVRMPVGISPELAAQAYGYWGIANNGRD